MVTISAVPGRPLLSPVVDQTADGTEMGVFARCGRSALLQVFGITSYDSHLRRWMVENESLAQVNPTHLH